MFIKLVRIFFLATILVLAVEPSVIAQPDSAKCAILVKDPRIDVLVKKQSFINKVNKEYKAGSPNKFTGGNYKGYRLIVKSTNDRLLAYKLKSDLLRNYPDQSVYMLYQSPFYKIKMGNFLKQDEAEKFKNQLVAATKEVVYIVPDVIRLKPEEEEKLFKDGEEKTEKKK